MKSGLLKKPLRCWQKTTPYDLQKGLMVSAEWDDTLKWWNVSFVHKHQKLQATTTDWPEV